MIVVRSHRRRLKNGRYILVREYRRLGNKNISPRVDSLNALYDYAYGYTNSINYGLRRGNPTEEELRIADRISKLETPMELPTLYRGTLWRHLSGDYGITRGNIHSMIGRTITDKGYLSTSIDKKVPKDMYPMDRDTVFMRIKSKGKHRAMDVNGLLGRKSPSPGQKEILLGRNTKFTIAKVNEKNGITYIDVELKS